MPSINLDNTLVNLIMDMNLIQTILFGAKIFVFVFSALGAYLVFLFIKKKYKLK